MMVRLGSVILGTTALLFSVATAITTSSASGFITKDKSVSFSLNIPHDEESNELYFTLSGTHSSWIAVGMGSDVMDESLMFLAYADSSGKNVTLSPRLSYGHVEPSYTSDVNVTLLPGTQITSGNITINAKCSNCRSWQGSSIDPTNTAAKFTYAKGPGSWLQSNSLNADTKRHSSFGAFTLDLTKAVGTAGVPQPIFANTAGTEQTSDRSDNEFGVVGHAILMILAFVVLMPVAVILLRVVNSPKWHGITQVVSVTAAIIGSGLGIYIGIMYNRTKNFNSAHQIVGIVVVLALFGQFILGYLHHRIYKRTQATTKLAPIHLWLGRVIIPVGIADGFLGFPLALSPKYNWGLLAIILFLVVIIFLVAFWGWKRNSRKQASGGRAYGSRPWMWGKSDSNIGLTDMNDPPPYQGEPAQQQRQFV